MDRRLRIDAWFDLVCPWCWIGSRHLAAALGRLAAEAPGVQVEVAWHPVRLIPGVPPEGWPYVAFYERRLGGPEAVKARQAQVQAAAARAGLAIRFDRMTVFPDTAAAHRLLTVAAGQLQARALDALREALFETYFVHGGHLGDADTLAAVARAHGVDLARAPLPEALPAASDAAPVSGVPYFIFDHRFALSGAQPPEHLLAAMQACLREPEPAAPSMP